MNSAARQIDDPSLDVTQWCEGGATARAGLKVPKFLEQYGKEDSAETQMILPGKDFRIRPPLKTDFDSCCGV